MFTEDSFGFSVTCNVSGVFAWFWQFLVGRLIGIDHFNHETLPITASKDIAAKRQEIRGHLEWFMISKSKVFTKVYEVLQTANFMTGTYTPTPPGSTSINVIFQVYFIV